MNLKDFAYQLLDQQEELESLRSRNRWLEQQIEKYQESSQQEFEHHQKTFGRVLEAALDKDSFINKRMRGEV